MDKLLRAAVVGLTLSLTLATVAQAADQAPAAAAAAYKAGDKVWICGCGKACDCATLQTKAGKCHCGKDLIEAAVTKVEAGKVTVEFADGEQVIPLKKA